MWENELLISEYTYDDNGNRTSKNGMAFSYDDQDRLVSGAFISYTYTANGDVLTKTDVFGTTTYDYDATGNLNSVILPDKTVSYAYDGMNRRIAKAVDGIVTERFIYLSQLKPFAKVNSDGSIAETYIYGTKVNIPEYVIRDGNTYRVITDHLGSLRLVIDSTDGTVKQRMSFDEFGTVTEDFIESGFEPLPFGYAGGLYDRDTKLVTFGVREYDSTTGRWMEKEPLGFRGAMNFYSYANNNPVNNYDFNGLKTTVITNDDDSVGHTALLIENDLFKVLWDPNGSYSDYINGNKLEDIVMDDGADISYYEAFHKNDQITTQEYDTNLNDELKMLERIEEMGSGDWNCTNDVNSAVKGLGPFDDTIFSHILSHYPYLYKMYLKWSR